MDKCYLINDRGLYPTPRTSIFINCFWLFHSQGCLLLNSRSKPHCTFELPILTGRPCQREIRICTDLRSDVRYHILCFTVFEARTLPTYNTHIIPTLTKHSCDEKLHWDWNYSTSVPDLAHLPPHQKLPPWTGKRCGHTEGQESFWLATLLLTRNWDLQVLLSSSGHKDQFL